MSVLEKELQNQKLKQVVRLSGLTCADCSAQFEQIVKNVPGVIDAKVNFAASKITIEGTRLSKEKLEELGAFENIKVVDNDKEESKEVGFWEKNRQTIVLGVSFVFLVIGFLADYLFQAPALSISTFITATLLSGWENFKKGIVNLFRLNFTMNTLMTVAIGGAFAIGYWEEAAVVAFLFGVSEMLEAYSADKARQSIRQLMDIAPKTALIVRNGKEQILSVGDIEVGDLMIVKPGEKIAMDGEVVKGSSSVNQAAITGESIPAEKIVGDSVFAGSLNQAGSIEVKVTKLVEDTTIAKIITMVEDAQEQRAPSQAFVDKFAKYYTPAVMVLAVAIALVSPLLFGVAWQTSIYNALALLIIACPCALVVSTPVSIVSAISNAARNGVLIKGGLHLENAGSLRAIAFDKTGTLTRGEPAVTDVIVLQDQSIEDTLSLAAGIEKYSEHPLAQAIVRDAEQRGITLAKAEDFQSVMGKGVQASINGKGYLIGNPRFFEGMGIPLTNIDGQIHKLQNEGKTAMIFSQEQKFLAIIAVADEVRESSKLALKQLKQAGIQKTIMLTGDNEATARAIAAQVGIDDFHAELLPEDKVSAVKELRTTYDRIGMVGDGVNDAPALATATTGFAMGGAGTDTALETADIALMADDLSKLPFTIRLSRSALRVVKQNIAFSLTIKAVATLLVFPGWLTLWLAILADVGATILVTANGMRLLKIKPDNE